MPILLNLATVFGSQDVGLRLKELNIGYGHLDYNDWPMPERNEYVFLLKLEHELKTINLQLYQESAMPVVNDLHFIDWVKLIARQRYGNAITDFGLSNMGYRPTEWPFNAMQGIDWQRAAEIVRPDFTPVSLMHPSMGFMTFQVRAFWNTSL